MFSIERLGKHNQREAQVTAASGCFSFEEAPDAKVQGLVTEHILISSELSTIQWTLSATIHLPQVIIRRLHKADIV